MDILVNSFSIKQFEKSLPSTKIISPGINSELWSVVTICVSEFDTLSINNMFCPKCGKKILINACSPLKIDSYLTILVNFDKMLKLIWNQMSNDHFSNFIYMIKEQQYQKYFCVL